MRLGKFLTTMVAGFFGAALLLGVAYATGVVGSSSTTVKTVQGEPVAFKTTGYTPQEIYEKYVGSVVEIQSTFPGSYDMWGQYSGDQRALGTGFVVSEDGDILTNAHVVSESGLVAGSVTVIFKGDGADDVQVPGTIVGVDDSTDVALIRVDPSTAPSSCRFRSATRRRSRSAKRSSPSATRWASTSRSRRASSPRPIASCSRQTARSSPAASRPTLRSTPVTPAVR